MQRIRITTSQNIDIDYEQASVGLRLLAWLLDALIIFVLYVVLLISGAIGHSIGGDRLSLEWVLIGLGIFVVFYDLLFEILSNGQSPGKRMMNIRVISLDGGRPTIGQFMIRWLFRVVDIGLSSGVCAIISIVVSDRGQRIGDIAARTAVVSTKQRVQSDHLVFRREIPDYKTVFPQAANLSDKDIQLIHEVLRTYYKSGNPEIVYQMANRVKSHLSVTTQLTDYEFLNTIIKDFNHSLAEA